MLGSSTQGSQQASPPGRAGQRGRSRQSVWTPGTPREPSARPWALLPVCLGISGFPSLRPTISPEKPLQLHTEGAPLLTVCPAALSLRLGSAAAAMRGFPLQLLLFWPPWVSVAALTVSDLPTFRVACRMFSCGTWGQFPDQGSNSGPLRWECGVSVPGHQGSSCSLCVCVCVCLIGG